MKITISNEITIENPTSQMILYCEKNLTLKNPDFTKKKRMGLWTGNTPETIALYRVDGNKLILPTGAGKAMRQFVGLTKPEIDLANNPPVDYKADIPLYDYQAPAVEAMAKQSCGILNSKPGSGKTQMAIALAIELGMKTLFLVHTNDLLEQAYDRAKMYIDESLLGKISAGKVQIGKGITVATVQTMSKLDLSQYKYSFDVVIADECHRVCGTPTGVTMFSKTLNSLAARHKYGLSGTVHRGDGLIEATFALLGPIIYTVPDEAISDKTMQVTVQKIDTGIEISEECLDTDGTLIYGNMLKYLCENTDRCKSIAYDLIHEGNGHSNLILSDRLEQLRIIKQMTLLEVPENQVRMIDGSMTSKKGRIQRQQAIEDMRKGTVKYLFASYSLASTGLDIPILDRLYLISPAKDYSKVVQSVGRIARKANGKQEPICFDYVDDIGYCQNAWKKRKTHYRKAKCVIKENS